MPEVVFHDLDEVFRRRFEMLPIAVYETSFETEAEERVLFDRINFTASRKDLKRASS
jgi:hypothetical protein